MKNAIYFSFFQLLILFIYFFSLGKAQKPHSTPYTNLLEAKDLVYTFYTEKGDKIQVEGYKMTKNGGILVELPKGHILNEEKESIIYFAGKSLRAEEEGKFLLKGDVELKFGDNRLHTDIIEFDSNKNTLLSPVNTEISTSFGTIKGSTFLYKIKEKNLQMEKIKGTIWEKGYEAS